MTSHYLTKTGNLKTNTFTKAGYVFIGWNTEPDGTGTSYKNGKLMSDLTESKTPVTFGASMDGSGNPFRYLDGTLKNMRIKLQVKPEDFE